LSKKEKGDKGKRGRESRKEGGKLTPMNESLMDLMNSGTTSSIGQKSCLGCFFIPHAEQIEIMHVLQNESMGR